MAQFDYRHGGLLPVTDRQAHYQLHLLKLNSREVSGRLMTSVQMSDCSDIKARRISPIPTGSMTS